ncbi:uncharacterized protein LOC112055917 isoform X2 [Bicyclus anynana]|uniref:Uncharacterized protein LOC112055917 isoform X2 n=1 Tax=Bicyclus anynana TaxID=110368 RepID=A0A6J1P334_BICAN|nr:uncharacterized protein LOC112055917 isoform X2 [Bicyclus anynana]
MDHGLRYDDQREEKLEFNKHLSATKSWYARISCANKKRFILALLKDVRSAWTLALILKSIWNCRPKDAVMSVSEPKVWSSYDQVPMDHNRTALPLSTLIEVMMSDRKWFQSLVPERQAVVLSQLLSMSGGPVMWETLKRAQKIYDSHVEIQLNDLLRCEVVQEEVPRKKSASIVETLETNLALWASTVKTLKDQMKLEELEMTYKSGSTKVWKVHRQKPEVVETVDLIQLLPSAISKRILIYLNTSQLMDCARVNKYWAHLVEELRAEIQTRLKIDIELEKLRENIIKNNKGLEQLKKFNQEELGSIMTLGVSSTGVRHTKERSSPVVSNKSCSLSLTTAMNKQRKIPRVRTKPIQNMNDLNERLERRGAADENVWKWCRNVLKISKNCNQIQIPVKKGGILAMTTDTFPGPTVSKTVKIPLKKALIMDPTQKFPTKPREIVTTSNTRTSMNDRFAKQAENKHYCTLCSKELTRLYPVCKCLCNMEN